MLWGRATPDVFSRTMEDMHDTFSPTPTPHHPPPAPDTSLALLGLTIWVVPWMVQFSESTVLRAEAMSVSPTPPLPSFLAQGLSVNQWWVFICVGCSCLLSETGSRWSPCDLQACCRGLAKTLVPAHSFQQLEEGRRAFCRSQKDEDAGAVIID